MDYVRRNRIRSTTYLKTEVERSKTECHYGTDYVNYYLTGLLEIRNYYKSKTGEVAKRGGRFVQPSFYLHMWLHLDKIRDVAVPQVNDDTHCKNKFYVSEHQACANHFIHPSRGWFNGDRLG